MQITRYEVEELIIDYGARKWCLLPYPNHPKGCPNYNKSSECPPNAPLVGDFVDITKKMWFIVIKFDLSSHVAKMKDRHPYWTDKQARCVLYWQNTVRRRLRDACIIFATPKQLVYTLIPEAMGVQVIKSAKKLDIPIKTRPIDTVYKIALIGYPKVAQKSSKTLFRKRR